MKRVVIILVALSILIVWGRRPITQAKGEDTKSARGRELKGTVVDPNGHPVAEAHVRLRKGASIQETDTDGRGGFAFDGLEEGPYEVDVDPPESGRRAWVDGKRLHDIRPPAVLEVRLPWVPLSSRPGTLRVSASVPAGVARVEVWVIADPPRQFEQFALKGKKCTASQNGLGAGRYRVLVRAGELAGLQDVEVRGGTTTRVSVPLQRGACCRLHVRDGKGGPPLPSACASPLVEALDGAWVSLPCETADGNGDLILRGMVGRGGIEVSGPGHVTRILLRIEDSMEVALDREP